MATKKQEEVVVDKKVELKKYLVINMPGMFNRTPDITGDLDKFVDEIINLIK
jgi:hypothetical protein